MTQDALFASLSRHPDVEADNLFAYDSADALILDEAGDLSGLGVTVVGDRYGALTLGALVRGARHVRVHQDSIVGERALLGNAGHAGRSEFEQLPLASSLVSDARLVLVQLPRSLNALEEIAELIAAHAHPGVRVVAGGRVKHMSLGMNDVLARSFDTVQASRGVRKARVLHASGPRAAAPTWPRRETHDAGGTQVTVVAHGAAFAGASIDIGAQTLIECFSQMPEAAEVIDLACGTGVLGATLALQRPQLLVHAFDASAAAVDSARASAESNGLAERMSVTRADGLEGVASGSAQLVLLNPPFHIGATVHTGIAERLIADAMRVLAPGGELWCVWNSHLGYRGLLDSLGQTRQIVRNSKFTVTATRA
ncbi:class I SAM-dependent methyltransferase [Agrococcus casei]|uniref:23S rRNA (Guanine-N-2-)-methyltransferase rlmG n=1 Tax=Agrococcus casei LMG 22410 TaxID=1255656 RepID=A0A1R4FLB9_9MICO|nr:methyltransferase [Agrococcus casei]SJM56718.1 23S rRNA (guanine-N-2-)-methyltransferase rlmG [Agrococcus casei LMG 22410]